jgi:hypothetical protein
VVSVGEGPWAFVPDPLPPKLAYGLRLVGVLSEADRALGELAGLGRRRWRRVDARALEHAGHSSQQRPGRLDGRPSIHSGLRCGKAEITQVL